MATVAGRRTNLALLVLLAGALATGGLMYAIGTGWNRWATVVHGAIGVAVVVLAPWKSAIARRGVRRRGSAASTGSLVLSLLVAIALVTGFAHRAGVRDLGPVLVMQIHVGAALAAVPLMVWHVVARPVRPHRIDLSRRAALRAGAVGAGSVAATVLLPSGSGRFTGSLERGSFDPATMPVTQWLDDDVPTIDRRSWNVRIAGKAWSLDDLDRLGEEVSATLDCTGGWFATQVWFGVRLDRVVPRELPGRTLEVVSATGYRRLLPRADEDRLWLATRAGGEPLSDGHGAPARLVAPGRRGFWWVKWVTDIRPSDRPWWWQSPFPLS